MFQDENEKDNGKVKDKDQNDETEVSNKGKESVWCDTALDTMDCNKKDETSHQTQTPEKTQSVDTFPRFGCRRSPLFTSYKERTQQRWQKQNTRCTKACQKGK